MPKFERYIGIDYSGAESPTASLKGLRVYEAYPSTLASEVLPPPGPRKYWTRQGIAKWLMQELAGGTPTMVGIDHGFSFPVQYFERHGLALNWDAFLEDFVSHWPTHEDRVSVDFVRRGSVGLGASRSGDARWRRECELRCRAKSVFHFDVQGSVAKSTHSGIPWLWQIRKQFGNRVHFWPFDGWDVPLDKPVVLEAYPALYKRDYPVEDRTPDQHDAFSIASWLRDADAHGHLKGALDPDLSSSLREQAEVEGWILGVQ